MKNKKKIFNLHPIVTFLIITAVIILLSFVFYIFNISGTYDLYSIINKDYSPVTESVVPLLNLSGLKYIFTNSVTNFANFSTLTNLIIILIGIGIMDKSGFLQTSVTLLTKKAKKTTVTFFIILICLFASIIGDLSYLIFLPLVSLFFYYAKRNPFIGLISSYGALTIGSGISFLFTSVDSALREITVLNADILQVDYIFNTNALFFINFIVLIAVAFLLTKITEDFVAKRLPKYNFTEVEMEEDIVTKKELKGMILSLLAGFIYLIIIIYNIIPGLPLSGNLLDYSQSLYIDKLFSTESFFSNGFVFIITMLFVIWGLIYGIVSKSFKNSNDVVDGLGHSLNGIGKILLLIFAASIFISVFRVSNIGPTIVVILSNFINNLDFVGMPLVILLLIASAFATLFIPSSVMKWGILSSVFIPAFMNAGLTPEFAQLVFRLGECVTMPLTPLLAYFIVYLAYMEKFNQESNSISILDAIKYQVPYALSSFVIILIILVLFFIANIPLGIGGAIAL